MRLSSSLLVLAATFTVALSSASPAAAGPAVPIVLMPSVPGPAQTLHGDAIRYASEHPDAAPSGANDPSCIPTDTHPNPVILVHGTDASAYADWAGMAPVLAAAGHCVHALNFGASPDGSSYGFGDIRESAAQLREFAESVAARSGASAVDVVGYSQGAAVARYYTNRLGGAELVDKWIGIASPTYGGNAYGFSPAVQAVPGALTLVSGELGPALVQLMEGSEFLTELNAGGDTVPGVEYTSIATRVDEVIQPYTNALLRDSGANNVVVQDVCPQNNVAHFAFTYDATTAALVLAALDPSADIEPPCESVPLGTGILDVIIASN
ncbi:MAG: alpha/beta fold hydrolase [Rhodococcus sp. (in: high G+C Gram-positive bacteria)]